MSTTTGIDYVVKVNTGTPSVPVYTKVAGQRGGTLNRSAGTADLTTKDSGNWKEGKATIREWGIDTDGLIVEDDTAYQLLETAWENGDQVLIQMVTASGVTKTGLADITDFPEDVPYDAEATYSVSFQGSGALTVVP